MTTKYCPRCGFDPLDPITAADRADLDRPDLSPRKLREPDRLARVLAYASPKKNRVAAESLAIQWLRTARGD